MTIYNIVDIFTCLIESICTFMLYETFLTRKLNIPKWLYGFGIITLVIVINISNTYFNYGFMNVAVMILSFFAASLLYNGKISLKIIFAILSYLLIIITEITVLFGITMLYNISVEEVIDISEYRILGTVVSKMCLLLVVNAIKVIFKKNSFHTGISYWVLLLVMFATSTTVVFLIFTLSFNTTSRIMYNAAILSSLGLLFSTFFALYLYEHLGRQAETIRNQQQYEQNLKMQLKNLDEILITQKQIKKFRHDFDNYTIGLKAYIDNGDYIGAGNYIMIYMLQIKIYLRPATLPSMQL